MTDHRRSAPHVARNAGPIAEVLRDVLPARGLVLEVASGTGEHVAAFRARLPETALAAERSRAGGACARSRPGGPRRACSTCCRRSRSTRARRSGRWRRPTRSSCINMVHISPWAATAGLMRGAGRLLAAGRAALSLRRLSPGGGRDRAEQRGVRRRASRARDPEWGVRDLEDVVAEAEGQGFRLDAVIAMPANNLSVVFRNARRAGCLPAGHVGGGR